MVRGVLKQNIYNVLEVGLRKFSMRMSERMCVCMCVYVYVRVCVCMCVCVCVYVRDHMILTNLISRIGVSSSSEELTSYSQDLMSCWRTTENLSNSADEHLGLAAMECNAEGEGERERERERRRERKTSSAVYYFPDHYHN